MFSEFINTLPKLHCPLLDDSSSGDDWEKKIELTLGDNDIISYMGYMEEWFINRLASVGIQEFKINPFDNDENEEKFFEIFNQGYVKIEPILAEAEFLLTKAQATKQNELRWDNLAVIDLCQHVREVRNNSAFEIHNLIEEGNVFNI